MRITIVVFHFGFHNELNRFFLLWSKDTNPSFHTDFCFLAHGVAPFVLNETAGIFFLLVAGITDGGRCGIMHYDHKNKYFQYNKRMRRCWSTEACYACIRIDTFSEIKGNKKTADILLIYEAPLSLTHK